MGRVTTLVYRGARARVDALQWSRLDRKRGREDLHVSADRKLSNKARADARHAPFNSSAGSAVLAPSVLGIPYHASSAIGRAPGRDRPSRLVWCRLGLAISCIYVVGAVSLLVNTAYTLGVLPDTPCRRDPR